MAQSCEDVGEKGIAVCIVRNCDNADEHQCVIEKLPFMMHPESFVESSGSGNDCSLKPAVKHAKEQLLRARTLAVDAVQRRKVFAIEGSFPLVRSELMARGWVENLEGSPHRDKLAALDSGLWGIVSRLVRHKAPDFVWRVSRQKRPLDNAQNIMTSPAYLNFNTKSSLVQVIQNIPKICSADPDAVAPRTYRMHQDREANLFYRDYLFTACCNLLKTVAGVKLLMTPYSSTWSCRKFRGIPRKFPLSSRLQQADLQSFDKNTECYTCGPDILSDNLVSWLLKPNFMIPTVDQPEKGHAGMSRLVPDEVIRMAVCHAAAYLEVEDEILYADRLAKMQFIVAPDDQNWHNFIRWTYLVRSTIDSESEALIKLEETDYAAEKLEYCNNLLHNLSVLNPQCKSDGKKNIWIIKPGSKSRGMEITVSDQIEEITEICYNHQGYPDMRNFIVQKYIEKPFLCHKTKFDIRQWFLVTWHPLRLWMYQDCYLRFSSSEFSLTDFDEKIHLTNNAVQGKYFSTIPPESKMPKECMWQRDDFISYLCDQSLDGHALWSESIFPEITRLLTLALITSAVQMDKKAINGYELFGADFILTEDLKPWLIEINSGPDLNPTTTVTATLCPEVITDCIKVVIDHLRHRSANTGKFRLAFVLKYNRRQGKAFKIRSTPLEILKPIRRHRLRIAKSRRLFEIRSKGNPVIRTMIKARTDTLTKSQSKHYTTFDFIQESVRNVRRAKAMRRFQKKVFAKVKAGSKNALDVQRIKKPTQMNNASTSSDHDSSTSDDCKTTTGTDFESFQSDESGCSNLETEGRPPNQITRQTVQTLSPLSPSAPKSTSSPARRLVNTQRLEELAQPKSVTLIKRWESGRISRKKKWYSGLSVAELPRQSATEGPVPDDHATGDPPLNAGDHIIFPVAKTVEPQLNISASRIPRSQIPSAGCGDISSGLLSKYYISAAVQREIDQYITEPAQNLRLHMTLRNALRRCLPKSGHWIKLIDGFIRNPNNNTLKNQTRNLMHSIMLNQLFVSPSEIFRTFEKLNRSKVENEI